MVVSKKGSKLNSNYAETVVEPPSFRESIKNPSKNIADKGRG